MGITRRNHFIPQFYLRYFTDNNYKFYQYNKINKIFEPNKSITPKDVCFIKDYYNFIDKEEKKNDYIESKFLQSNETKAKVIIEKLIKIEEIIDRDLPELIIFLCLLKYRTPRFKAYFDKSKSPKLLQEFYESTKTDKDKRNYIKTYAKNREDINEENFYEKILINQIESYKRLFHGAFLLNGLHKENLEVFFNKNWFVLKIKNLESFIVSDDPVTIVSSNELLKNFKEIINNYEDNHTILFPLTNKLCLLLIESHKDQGFVFKGYSDIKENQVLEINKLILKNSYKYVYSSDKNNILKII